MNTVDYQPFAAGVTADVETQAQFLTDLANPAALKNGFVTGTALTPQVNKVARQSSVMTAALANAISQALVADVLDDGNVANLTAQIIAMITAIAAPASTGDLKLTLKTVADVGWVLCNDGSIGNAASGGTARANADTVALFTLLYNTFPNAICPVLPGGRGANAGADFGANKTIALTKMLGRALAIAGAGGGLTPRVLGSIVGEEAHQQIIAEMATHNHGVNDPGHQHGVAGSPGAAGLTVIPGNEFLSPQRGAGVTDPAATGVTIQNQGGNQAANVMQPTSFVNVMIKL